VRAVARELEALLFRPSREDANAPEWLVVDEVDVPVYRVLGWFLLCLERDVRRYADVDEVREDDERGRR
jgi:hypothetical protein